MAEFYLDHGAYAAQGVLGLNVPTAWGVPQEGDGGGKYAATAAPVAEITLLANAVASEQIVIAGATITAGASQTTNVFARGGSIAATVANIVALLNSASATATVSSSVAVAVGNNSNQLRNMVYARVKPADTSTVQIMFRIGSTALNHATNSAVAISSAGGWSSSPTVVQFVGGTSGCFGYFAYPGACGHSSSIAVYRYGLFCDKPHVVKSGASSTYEFLPGDIQWCRSGAGRTVTMPTTGSAASGRQGSAGHLNFILDSNTVWTEDGGTGVFRYEQDCNSGSSQIIIFNNGNSLSVAFAAMVPLALQFGQVGSTSATYTPNTNGFRPVSNTNSHSRFKNVRFFSETTGGTWPVFGYHASGGSGLEVIEDCVLDYTEAKNGSGGYLIGIAGSGGSTQYARNYTNFQVRFNYSGITPPALLGMSGTQSVLLRWVGGRVYGSSVDFPLFLAGLTLSGVSQIVIDMLEGVEFPTALLGLQNAPVTSAQVAEIKVAHIRMSKAGFPFRYEDQAAVVDWVPSASPAFPTLGALLPDGTPYSMRCLWMNNSASHVVRGLRLPPITQVCKVTPAAVATITLELFLPTALAFSAANLTASLIFRDDTGVLRSASAHGGNMQSSSATWTNAGSYGSYSAKKLVISTGAYKIAPDSEVVVQCSFYGLPSTAQNEYLFTDPAFGIG